MLNSKLNVTKKPAKIASIRMPKKVVSTDDVKESVPTDQAFNITDTTFDTTDTAFDTTDTAFDTTDTKKELLIKFNKSFPTGDSIKKYLGTTHGLNLIVLSLMDHENKNLEIKLKCVDNVQSREFADQIKNILKYTGNIKVYHRSIKLNGIFLEIIDGIQYEKTNDPPLSGDLYLHNSHIIADLEIDGDVRTWKFYKFPETTPRMLHMCC